MNMTLGKRIFDSLWCFIAKCDRSLLKNASGFLFKTATVLLQNATVFTTCDGFFIKCDVITKCDSISVKLVNK